MLELASLTRRFNQPTNRLYRLRQTLLARRTKIVDLVSGNMGGQGTQFPPRILERAFAQALRKTKVYRPDPLGRLEARQSISDYYRREGLKISADHIVLTPGTSVSYWYAFKILADPGDEILVPTPTYPLFESIARLAGVKLVPYRLLENSRWKIDFEGMQSALTGRTRAAILVSPHNPTGAVATEDEVRKLAEIAARRNLAIISDEVFRPFLFTQTRLPSPAEHNAPLVLTLNGFSKMLALPGLKIGWMAVTGEPGLVNKTIKALDMVSDTFLPVAEAAQAATPALLRQRHDFQSAYADDVRRRLKLAERILSTGSSFSYVMPEGGIYLTLALKKPGVNEEEIACRLLEKHRILVHPGYFYDMEGDHLILSFVNQPAVLRKALERIIGEIR